MGGRWMLFFEKYLSVRASGASEVRDHEVHRSADVGLH